MDGVILESYWEEKLKWFSRLKAEIKILKVAKFLTFIFFFFNI